MFRRLLARVTRPQPPDTSAWWREANAIAEAPDSAAVSALKARVLDAGTAPDIAELQEEMIDGLERLLALAAEPALPVVATQHRVIGTEVCHFITPASLIQEVDASGKIFVTADRLVFASGTVKQWPWHSIAAIARVERDLLIDLRGRPGAARLRANTYGDAMVIIAMAGRLRGHRS